MASKEKIKKKKAQSPAVKRKTKEETKLKQAKQIITKGMSVFLAYRAFFQTNVFRQV